MKKVFFHCRTGKAVVFAEDSEVMVKEFSPVWKFFELASDEFTVKMLDNERKFVIDGKGEYAVYKDEVLKLQTCMNRVLAIMDLQNPIDLGLRDSWETWSKFWVTYYVFNRSKVVFCGDYLEEVIRMAEAFSVEPDLIISNFGRDVYEYREGVWEIKESFQFFKVCGDEESSLERTFDDLKCKFDFIGDLVSVLGDHTLIFEIPNDCLEYLEDIKKFVSINITPKNHLTLSSHLTQNSTSQLLILSKPSPKFQALQFTQHTLSFSDQETILSTHSLSSFSPFTLPITIISSSKPFIPTAPTVSALNHSSHPIPVAIQDYLFSSHKSEKFSTIFLYSQLLRSVILVNSEEIPTTTFKSKWQTFKTCSLCFFVQNDTGKTKYKLQKHGRYAIYRNKLIQISNNLKRLLFVTDLDNTIFNKSSQGLKYYRAFIEFWIEHFEFNGSIFAYNTGRDLNGFVSDIQKLFLADIHFLSLGTFAYILNEELNLVQDQNFLNFFQGLKTCDWDSQILVDAVIRTFGLSTDSIKAVYHSYFVLKIEAETVDRIWDQIKSFIRNKENREIDGRVFYGKVRLLCFKKDNLRLLEFVPVYAGKKVGVKYAQKKFGFEQGATVTAGDSMNDADSLKNSGLGIVMKNSEGTLLDWIKKRQRNNLIVTSEIYGLGLLQEFKKLVKLNP